MHIKKNNRSLISTGITALLTFTSAQAASFLVDFELDDAGIGLSEGFGLGGGTGRTQPYDNLFGPGSGVTFNTDNPTSFPLNLYNSDGTGGEDPDLERNGGFAGGNDPSAFFGNLIIINEDLDLGAPDDEGAGGDFIIDFDLAATSFGFGFVDLDAGAALDNSTLTFSGSTGSVTINFTDLEGANNTDFGQTGVEFGNDHANTITPFTADQLAIFSGTAGFTEFDRVVVSLAGSGGIGAISGTVVPEPSSFMLISLGGVALAFRRRK